VNCLPYFGSPPGTNKQGKEKKGKERKEKAGEAEVAGTVAACLGGGGGEGNNLWIYPFSSTS